MEIEDAFQKHAERCRVRAEASTLSSDPSDGIMATRIRWYLEAHSGGLLQSAGCFVSSGTTSASRSVEASTSSILSYLTEFWPINFSREQESVVQSITKNRNCKTAVIYRTARMAQCGDRTRARRYFLASLAARRGVAA